MIAAIVLAAGSSSRMGPDILRGAPSKALLPLGSELVLERVMRTVRLAGIGETLVVTGHGASDVATMAEALGARAIHNPDYLLGMFTSFRTGLRELGPAVQAFFVMPVDCPLVRPEILLQLLRHQETLGAGADATILHPTCCGTRGHPPLIPTVYRDELLAGEHPGGLRGFFQRRHAAQQQEVEVQDLTALIDVNIPRR